MRRQTRVHRRQVAGCLVIGLAGFSITAWAVVQEPPSDSEAGAGAAIKAVPSPARPASRRAVYVCQEGGIPVFADRPCGAAAASRTLVVAAPGPGAAPSTTPAAPRSSTRPRVQPAESSEAPHHRADTHCVGLQRQLDDLDDRMRSGYSAREAARLWHRWRDLKDRLRRERC